MSLILSQAAMRRCGHNPTDIEVIINNSIIIIIIIIRMLFCKGSVLIELFSWSLQKT